MAWLLLLLGRLLAIAGAGLIVGVVIGMTAEACCAPFHYGRDWNFWWFTAVVELQAGLAAWIIWSVFERGPRPLLVLLALPTCQHRRRADDRGQPTVFGCRASGGIRAVVVDR